MRKQVFNCFFQYPLPRHASELDFGGYISREFHKGMIEEWHAALNGRGHAHVVLLHQSSTR